MKQGHLKNTASETTYSLAEFDIHKLDIGPGGVKDFFWPISQDELTAFVHAIMREYAAIVKKAGDDMALDVIPYKLMAKYFICEAAGVFQGDLLRERCANAGKAPQAPPSWRLWPSLFKKERPAKSPFIEQFYRGPAKTNYRKSLFNFSRMKKLVRRFNFKGGRLSFGGLKIKKITPEDLREAIITTQHAEAITLHAAIVKKNIIFCRSQKWFESVDNAALSRSINDKNEKLEKDIISSLEKLYLKSGMTLEAHAREYMAYMLEEGAALLRVHYQRLLEKPETLPSHVWTATGGYIWDVMLRLAVKANGGTAEGHAHAMGQGVYKVPLTPFIELWGANCYVTYNQSQIDGLQSSPAIRWATLDSDMPVIKSLNQQKNKTAINSFSKFNRQQPKIKTIALMATVYDGDFGRMEPLPSNITAIDWQARLITRLREWGYDVILKIHPESLILPPASFESELGARIISDPFETILDQVDMTLFDYIYTTTFRSVLETNIPVTIADYYNIAWSENVQELIEKRCAVVKGYYDKSNRAQINWAALKEGIEKAPLKCNNHDFACRYLP